MNKTARDLAEEYLADVLDPAEADDYVQLLLRDDDAIRELLAASRRELVLRSALKVTLSAPAQRSTRRRAPAPAHGFRWAIAAAAAALLAVGLYLALSDSAPPEQPIIKVGPKAPAPKPTPEPRPAPDAPPEKPQPPPAQKPKIDRESIDRDLLEASERAKNNPAPAPAPTPVPEPKPEPQAPVPPAPEPQRPTPPSPQPVVKPTETVIARIDAVAGDVRLVPGGAAVAKSDLHRGQSLETRSRSSMTFTFIDGSTFDLGPDTHISQVQTDGGRKIVLEKGTLRGTVAKQPKDQPLLIATPHGEAKVLGTVLRIHVDPDPRKGTKLDVTEGRVELKNLAGRKVSVDAGNTATAAAGAPLVASFLEMDGWLRNTRNTAGNTGYGELEIADDPLETGKKCFRLSYPTTLQGVVLTLPTRIPLSEFDGISFEVYIPVDSPKGVVLDSEFSDSKNSFATTNQVTVKRGSWQPVTFKPNDYMGIRQLEGFVIRMYICELLPGVAADAAPTHTVYYRKLQIRRTPPPK